MTTKDLREVVATYREEQATYYECVTAMVHATTRDPYDPYGY